MKRVNLLAACAALVATPAFADNCTKLVNHNMCLTFTSSRGGNISFTAHFGPAGAFSILEVFATTGTYTCKGRSFVEVNYAYGGFETQQWYAKAGSNGTKLASGFGKSITNGYLYKIVTTSVGACPAEIVAGAPIIRSSQNE